jgi:ribosomal protein S25
MASHFRESLYKFISSYVSQYNDSPSFSQIAQAMKISLRSKSLITRSLRIMEKEGKITLVKQGRRLLILMPYAGYPEPDRTICNGL